MDDEMNISIGTKLWVRRDQYERRVNNTFDDLFKVINVFGENRVNWLVGYQHSPQRLGKKTLAFADGREYYLTEEEAREAHRRDGWIRKHRYMIEVQISRCRDFETLKRVADLLGYDDGEVVIPASV